MPQSGGNASKDADAAGTGEARPLGRKLRNWIFGGPLDKGEPKNPPQRMHQ
jgi:hypothetical protein